VNGVAGTTVAGERLGLAIFLAAAAHGILILGVNFTAPPPGGDEAPTLEVTLLDAPTADQEAPENPEYLAQANQDGAGNVPEQVRPEFHETPPAPEPPEPREAREDPPAELVASWASSLVAAIAPQRAEDDAPPPEALPEGGLTRVTVQGEREYFVSVSARESVFAEYLASWKARMERIGTLNYPVHAIGQRSGNPVLEVQVAASGSLKAVRVTHSSGSSALDQAAMDLVRIGSPYDPFPAAVRAHYDVLTFAYEWRFIEGRLGEGRMRANPP
jgi:periplasmic protein TonB